MELQAYLLNYIKNIGGGGSPAPVDLPIISDCSQLFANNKRVSEANNILPQCKPTNAKAMFFYSTNLTDINVIMDLSNIEDMNMMSDMFSGCSNLTNDSLNNVLASLATATFYSLTKELSRIGISQAQADICVTLSNWPACVSAGWSTGY